VDSTPLDQPTVQAINADASRLMKQGIVRLTEGGEQAVFDALSCFDQALELRRRLPIDSDPLFAYGLAACLLNRGDALAGLGAASYLVAALDSYDEGIRVLRDLPLGDDPRFRRRLAMAHHNRGLALRMPAAGRVAEAIDAFSEAIVVIEGDRSASIPDRKYLLAVALMNLADTHLSAGGDDATGRAMEAARTALTLMATDESTDIAAAEVGLHARHVCCRALASRLPTTRIAGPIPDDVHDATDLVDSGLALARRWEREGVSRFRGIAYDLFRFGARVYQLYQPQFLPEFVRENQDPHLSSADYVNSAEMQSAAHEIRLLWSTDH
jgi:tetratricopeptide (TPR) repeat protein